MGRFNKIFRKFQLPKHPLHATDKFWWFNMLHFKVLVHSKKDISELYHFHKVHIYLLLQSLFFNLPIQHQHK